MKISFDVPAVAFNRRALFEVPWPNDMRLPVVGDDVGLEYALDEVDILEGPEPPDGQDGVRILGVVTNVTWIRSLIGRDSYWHCRVRLK